MRRFLRRHKRVFVAIVVFIIVLAMVFGPLAAFMQVF